MTGALPNRKAIRPTDPFSLSHKLFRVFWRVSWFLLASWTPPAMVAWRRFLLRLFGARMARGSDVRGSAKVWHPPNLVMEENTIIAQDADCYNQATVTIRAGAIVSQCAHLCAGGHDIDDPEFALVAKPIDIGSGAWIAAEAFVGPGVTVGARAVLGARAVTFRDLAPNTVYIGNPATVLRQRF